MEKVILLKCNSYDQAEIDGRVEKIFSDLGGIEKFVPPGKKVLVKPNMFAAFPPERAATTHPSIVRAVCKMALRAGGKVFIAESPSPSRESFETKSRVSGMLKVAEELCIPLIELKDPVRVDTPEICKIRKMEFSKTAVEADVIINIAKMKSHTQQMFTAGVKNMFGCVVGTRKPEWHANLDLDRVVFASMLIDGYLFLKPELTIVDAVIGMDGDGPANGNPKQLGLVGASRDALMLDLSLFRRMNGDFSRFPLFQAARERNLVTVEAIDKMEITGDGETVLVKDFIFPDLGFALYSRGFIGKMMKQYCIAKPVGIPKNCTQCRSCEKICPKDAIKITPGRITYDYGKCIRCYCCQEVCPSKAITFKKPLLYRILNVTKLIRIS